MQACYRAMDLAAPGPGELEKQVYFQVADLLNLEVDLLFFDYHLHLLRAGGSRRGGAARLARGRPPAGMTPMRTRRPGSARTASPRTAAMTCRRS